MMMMVMMSCFYNADSVSNTFTLSKTAAAAAERVSLHHLNLNHGGNSAAIGSSPDLQGHSVNSTWQGQLHHWRDQSAASDLSRAVRSACGTMPYASHAENGSQQAIDD
jgi:hypothetical protein